MEERPDKGRGMKVKGYEGHWRKGKGDGAEVRKKMAVRGKEGYENGSRRERSSDEETLRRLEKRARGERI